MGGAGLPVRAFVLTHAETRLGPSPRPPDSPRGTPMPRRGTRTAVPHPRIAVGRTLFGGVVPEKASSVRTLVQLLPGRL